MDRTPRTAADAPGGQDAEHSGAGLGRLVVLWGVPGAGKSTFARWLVQEMGYEHVETDAAVLDGPATALQRAWITAGNARGIEAFVEAVGGNALPVVVEYGMWADDDHLVHLGYLRQLGAEPWWFDGERSAAKEAWREKNRRAGRLIEDAIWDRVVGVIDQNWAHIEAFFGSRVLRTIEPECHHVPAADTYHRMVEIRARDPS